VLFSLEAAIYVPEGSGDPAASGMDKMWCPAAQLIDDLASVLDSGVG
jgi:hypothetical protein